jgi:monofunctional biosynthetic peptidoglycan transglycosylase
MIELLWSKDRILELYLNISEMGEGVFGIEAASRRYFHKSAAKLTRQEAAMIAASLPNPKIYTVKPRSKWVNRKYPWVMQQMRFIEADPEIRKLVK